jgi:hypothetical protein
MSFAELLDTAFRLLRDHFVLLVGLTAVIQVPVYVALARLQADQAGVSTGAIVTFVAVLALSPIVTAALTHAVGQILLERTSSIGASLRVVFAMILPLTGTVLIAGLAIAFGFVLLIVPGIYLSLAWLLAWPVIVLERRFGAAALRRSRELMRGNMLRAIGVLVLTWLIFAVLTGVIGAVSTFMPLLGAVIEGFAQAISTAYGTVVIVLLYFDACCRKEAFDLEHLAQLVEARREQAA